MYGFINEFASNARALLGFNQARDAELESDSSDASSDSGSSVHSAHTALSSPEATTPKYSFTVRTGDNEHEFTHGRRDKIKECFDELGLALAEATKGSKKLDPSRFAIVFQPGENRSVRLVQKDSNGKLQTVLADAEFKELLTKADAVREQYQALIKEVIESDSNEKVEKKIKQEEQDSPLRDVRKDEIDVEVNSAGEKYTVTLDEKPYTYAIEHELKAEREEHITKHTLYPFYEYLKEAKKSPEFFIGNIGTPIASPASSVAGSSSGGSVYSESEDGYSDDFESETESTPKTHIPFARKINQARDQALELDDIEDKITLASMFSELPGVGRFLDGEKRLKKSRDSHEFLEVKNEASTAEDMDTDFWREESLVTVVDHDEYNYADLAKESDRRISPATDTTEEASDDEVNKDDAAVNSPSSTNSNSPVLDEEDESEQSMDVVAKSEHQDLKAFLKDPAELIKGALKEALVGCDPDAFPETLIVKKGTMRITATSVVFDASVQVNKNSQVQMYRLTIDNEKLVKGLQKALSKINASRLDVVMPENGKITFKVETASGKALTNSADTPTAPKAPYQLFKKGKQSTSRATAISPITSPARVNEKLKQAAQALRQGAESSSDRVEKLLQDSTKPYYAPPHIGQVSLPKIETIYVSNTMDKEKYHYRDGVLSDKEVLFSGRDVQFNGEELDVEVNPHFLRKAEVPVVPANFESWDALVEPDVEGKVEHKSASASARDVTAAPVNNSAPQAVAKKTIGDEMQEMIRRKKLLGVQGTTGKPKGVSFMASTISSEKKETGPHLAAEVVPFVVSATSSVIKKEKKEIDGVNELAKKAKEAAKRATAEQAENDRKASSVVYQRARAISRSKLKATNARTSSPPVKGTVVSPDSNKVSRITLPVTPPKKWAPVKTEYMKR